MRAEDGTTCRISIVFGSLDASLDDGSLAGTTFSVVFSYDADEVSPEGES